MVRLAKKVNLMKSIDVDKIPIERDSFIPNAYAIELPLDSQPGYVWHTLFEQEWKLSLHLWERKVVIIGDKLLLITTPNELQEKIDWLRRIIESTNLRAERFNETQEILEGTGETDVSIRHEDIIRHALRSRLPIA